VRGTVGVNVRDTGADINARFSNTSDRDYISAILNEDKDAQSYFIENFVKKICGHILGKFPSVMRTIVTKEELAHDIWIYLKEGDWKILRSFRGESKLTTYMYCVINRFLINKYKYLIRESKITLTSLKKQLVRELSFKDDEEFNILANIKDDNPLPDTELDRSEGDTREFISILLNEVLVPNSSRARLSNKNQRIIRLRYIARLSARETGELLGMSEDTVNTTLYRVKNRMRRYFELKGLQNKVSEFLNMKCTITEILYGKIKNKKSGCPPPEDIAMLLIEGKLDEEKSKTLLLHTADCNECVIEYALAKKTRGVAVPGIFNQMATMLRVGAGFLGGMPYNLAEITRGGSHSQQGQEAIQDSVWSSEEPYLKKVTALMRTGIQKFLNENNVALPQDFSNADPARELWSDFTNKKNLLDTYLQEMMTVSGGNIDLQFVLECPFLDILSLDTTSVRSYAQLLKDGRVKDITAAQSWIKLNPKRYFELAGKLPQEVWERYPAERNFFVILSWIANFPQERREEMLRLSPEEAKRRFEEE
jgi:RNA polymerase sigma factor (sigma-70 family)